MTESILPSLASIAYPTDEVIDALLAGIVRVKRRAEIYESDGVTPYNITGWNSRLIEGNVTVDRTRDERRMAEISLQNYDGALVQDPYGGFYYDKVIKTFWGIRYFDNLGTEQVWDTQIGEFMIDRISETRFPLITKLQCRDYTKKCLQSKLSVSLTFPAGTPIETIVRALAANSGITKFALPYTGRTYNLDIVFERGVERWAVMAKVADSIGYELYFRGDGHLTMRPYPDPTLSPLSWIFRGGETDGTLLNWERSSNDSRIKNHIIVIGATTSIDGYNLTVFAEVANDDPSSPTRRSKMGDRSEVIENDYFTDNPSALDFAQTRLRIAALEEFNIDFESVIIPWLEASDIIDIDDSQGSAYIPSRFLLSNFNFPLGLGSMSGQGRRVTIVGSDQTLEYQ